MDQWEQLRQQCMSCRACGLADTRTNVVFGVGSPTAEVLLVGEAPGASEDQQGEPFVGAAGKLLDDMLAMIGLRRQEIYITNSVKCRPPKNRDPLNTEKDACAGFLRRQLEVVRQAQFCIGRDASCGSVWQRVRRAVTIFSIMVTWALENAIETADSMKSRGYGLRGRTAFSIYRMEARDRYALAWLGFCGLYLLCGCLAGGLKWWYFPLLQGVMTQPFSISFYLAYLALCLTPVILDRREARAWRCSPSKT